MKTERELAAAEKALRKALAKETMLMDKWKCLTSMLDAIRWAQGYEGPTMMRDLLDERIRSES